MHNSCLLSILFFFLLCRYHLSDKCIYQEPSLSSHSVFLEDAMFTDSYPYTVTHKCMIKAIKKLTHLIILKWIITQCI